MACQIQRNIAIERIQSLVFGDHARSPSYTASSGLIWSRDTLTRKEVAPTLDMDAIPTGHQIFSFLDTVRHLSLYPVRHLLKLSDREV